jgi:ATP-dependent Clp protease adaptor protein ClpS
MTSTRSDTAVLERTTVTTVPKSKVIFHNDNKTSMEFVIEVLIDIFKKNVDEAYALMMAGHLNGSAVVGEYSFEMAEQKAAETTQRAVAAGYPLKVTVE